MRVLIQRVSEAAVRVEGEIVGEIERGLLLLVGIEEDDKQEDIDWLVNKTANIRIFSDDEGKMNYSLLDIDGEILVISQFTLHASTKKGNRPSFIKAAKPDTAIPLYESLVLACKEKLQKNVQKGVFGADMKVSLVNDGPVTIWLDSKNRE